MTRKSYFKQRRIEILKLVGKGYNDMEIIHEMKIGLPNLKTQISRAINYSNVTNRHEDFFEAFKQNYINKRDLIVKRVNKMNDEMKINEDVALLPIQTIKSVLKISKKTLEMYEKIGILKAERKNDKRYYSLSDLEKLKAIVVLTRDLRVNLAGVDVVLAILEKFKIKNYNDFAIEIAQIIKNKQEKINDNNQIKIYYCFKS